MEFLINVIVSAKNGNSIRIVQSREDFVNNSSIDVESIELQWADGTPNDEVRVELTRSRSGWPELIDLAFKGYKYFQWLC